MESVKELSKASIGTARDAAGADQRRTRRWSISPASRRGFAEAPPRTLWGPSTSRSRSKTTGSSPSPWTAAIRSISGRCGVQVGPGRQTRSVRRQPDPCFQREIGPVGRPLARHEKPRITRAIPTRGPIPVRAQARSVRGGQPDQETTRGATRLFHASASGSWRSLRTPGPSLEPQDEGVHLRRAVRHPHPRSLADGAAAPPGAGEGARHGRQGRPRAVRRHQAPGGGSHRRGGGPLRAVLHERSLAGRHAHQLGDRLQLDQAAARTRRNDRSRRVDRPHQEGAAAASSASRRSCSACSAASATWAACRT